MNILHLIFISLFILACNGTILQDFFARTLQLDQVSEGDIDYETKYIDTPVDHFNFGNGEKFKLRYLINTKYWKSKSSPIFFYAGNEGDITWFCNNTGFMWTVAAEFGAMLLFVEHRYYGQSLPFGNSSFESVEKRGYLSSEQALADFAFAVTAVKAEMKTTSKVIAFGGSYGGMLATWLRRKYPNIVHGAIAASAPIWWFGDLTPCSSYTDTITRDFHSYSLFCSANVRKSWSVIRELAASASGLKLIRAGLRLCKEVEAADIDAILDWLESTWGNLAMVNYATKADFLEPLPPWPMKLVCEKLSKPNPTEEELVEMLGDSLNVFYNYTGKVGCLATGSSATSDLGAMGWDFQSCTEMVMPMCNHGNMFPERDWDLASFSEGCRKRWGVSPRPNWVITQYGGKNLEGLTNVVFSNGLLDPWHPGGVLKSESSRLPVVVIKTGAHHADLRFPTAGDPSDVIEARNVHRHYIRLWLSEDEKPVVHQEATVHFLVHSFDAAKIWLLVGLIALLAPPLFVALLKRRKVTDFDSEKKPLIVRI